MNNLIKIMGVGIAVAGVYISVKGLLSELDTIEKKGLTLTSGIALIGLGYTVVTRLEKATDRLEAVHA